MEFINSWDNIIRADSYAKLEFPGTYFLAYRDLPEIIARHVRGSDALDFGCGTGRSTRFLKNLGFNVTGIDISENMLKKAREFDPGDNYRLVRYDDYCLFPDFSFDLIQSIFTFDNIPSQENRLRIVKKLSRLLKPEGNMIFLDSTPEIYLHEWASFTTLDFPENKYAQNGDIVKIIMTDVSDSRPVEDILWDEKSYREMFHQAGLELVEIYKPLGKLEDKIIWKSEKEIAPWIIYVVRRFMRS
jgi:ubiquinone/menaquinone biosynthesis C-methylase UbiE